MDLDTQHFSARTRHVVLAAVAITFVCLTPPTGRTRSHPVPLASVPATQSLSVQDAPVTPIPRPRPEAESKSPATAYGQLPLAFEPNMGQTDARVQFLSRGNGYTFFLAADEAVLALRRNGPPSARAPKSGRPIDAGSTAAVRLQFRGANSKSPIEPSDALSSVTNYFAGNDPSRWHAGVPNYARVRQRDLYPGIDVVYYGNQRQLEYDFVVAPGADPGVIALNIDGADTLEIDAAGNLIVELAGGRMALKKPYAYQELNGPGGAVREVPVAYVIEPSRDVRFAAGAYDHDKTLVIDPVLVYGTFLGGTGLDAGIGLAVDGAGNAYVAGMTGSVDFPTTAGASQSANAGGTGDVLGLPTDAFVAKINAAGSALIYSTYLGGGGDDIAFGITVDAAGNAYVDGLTTSTNFPTTGGAFQTAYGGGDRDVFVTKLNASGGVVYSTYIGGGCGDLGWDIAVDASGSAYITGETVKEGSSTCTQNYPTTVGAFQTTFDQGVEVIVTKLNPAGSGLVYSTFLGGTTGPPAQDDFGRGIAVDASGNAYVTGGTTTTDFPTTPGAFQTTSANGVQCTALFCFDVFVTKLNSDGSALLYSTYLGGGGSEEANGIAIDPAGNAYVAGYTESTNFPTTVGAYQTTKRGGGTNAFVVKVNAAGTALLSSTLLGGSIGVPGTNASDAGGSIAVDGAGNVYVSGHTRAADFPTTPDALQATHGGGTSAGGFLCENGFCDGFVARFNPTLSILSYSSYLGGSGNDSPTTLALDASANVYLTGQTSSANFATTAGALQTGMPPGGVSGIWDGPAESNLPCIPCRVTVSLQRNGTTVAGIFGEGGVVQGVQTSESGGIFTYDVTSPITDAPVSCVNPGMTGTMTVNTNNNTLDASWSGINSDCLFETDTFALDKVGELASAFIVKLNLAPPVAGDYDGDGKAELMVIRSAPGTWFTLPSSTAFTGGTATSFGLDGDVPVPADYDGDGKTDVAVYRPSSGSWVVLQSTTGTTVSSSWGVSTNLPVPGDYDGDGKADLAVYRPSLGLWYIIRSGTSSLMTAGLGLSTDIPVPADYDGDGRTDVAVYRPGTGTWHIRKSGAGATTSLVVQWGVSGDIPVPGNYDGDGQADVAVYRPATGAWYLLHSSTNFTTFTTLALGLSTDLAVPADYDGDRLTDVAVFRPASGTWFILGSSTGYTTTVTLQWGLPGDVPAPGVGIRHAIAAAAGTPTRSQLANLVRGSDLDGDGKADLTVYRPSTGTWFTRQSSTAYGTFASFTFGVTTDLPVAGDFDGDGTTDAAVFTPSTGLWSILRTSLGAVAYQWGLNGDVPVAGDYDGDGVTDLAVWRPSTGVWHMRQSSTNFSTSVAHQWGLSGDVAAPGDYDGDGVTDLAVWRPSTGVWHIRQSTTGYATSVAIQWGLDGDIAVPGDYDGDGVTDLAVWRPASGMWYVRQSTTGFATVVTYQWGLDADIPVPGDFDGDGTTDLAVYRPSTGTWYLLTSSSTFTASSSVQWGLPGDIPILKRP